MGNFSGFMSGDLDGRVLLGLVGAAVGLEGGSFEGLLGGTVFSVFTFFASIISSENL